MSVTKENEKTIYQYWERFAIWVGGILIVVCGWLWLEQHARIADLETKVQSLQVDKVSRQELIALEDRLYKRMDGMKTDIIDRLDWYFSGRRSREQP